MAERSAALPQPGQMLARGTDPELSDIAVADLHDRLEDLELVAFAVGVPEDHDGFERRAIGLGADDLGDGDRGDPGQTELSARPMLDVLEGVEELGIPLRLASEHGAHSNRRGGVGATLVTPNFL